MQRIAFGISWSFIKILGLIPESLIYRQVRLISWFLRRCLKYRKKVLYGNLIRAFPDLTPESLEKLAEANYRILATTLLESLRGFTMNNAMLLERFTILHGELLNQYAEQGKSTVLLSSHIGNWEWAALGMAQQLKPPVYGIYKPLTNKYLERYVLKTRGAFGLHLIPVKQTAMAVQLCQEKPGCLVLVADQSPGKIAKAIWTPLFGIETPFVHGPEAIARENNWPVLYGDIKHTSQGHYTMEIEVLVENPREVAPGEITARYARKLESIIRKNPADWLWSHRRWKKVEQNTQPHSETSLAD